MGEGQLRAAGRWGPGTWDGTPRHKVWVPRKDLSSDASPTCRQPPLETAATVSSSGDGAPGSSVHVSAPQLVLSVGQSCSELSGPCSPPHRVRSPTPSADRTIAGPATVRWRPGPGAPLPPAPQTTSSWLQSKERTSRLVRAVAQGGALAGGSNGAWASHRDWNWRAGSKSSVWGRGAPAWPCPCQHHYSSFPGTSNPKEDGLDAQISRLAGLIGRLENKVGPPSPHIHPSIPPFTLPARQGGWN